MSPGCAVFSRKELHVVSHTAIDPPAPRSGAPVNTSLSVFVSFCSPSLLVISLFCRRSETYTDRGSVFVSSFYPLFSSKGYRGRGFKCGIPRRTMATIYSYHLSTVFTVFPSVPNVTLVVEAPATTAGEAGSDFLLGFLFLLFLFVVIPLSYCVLSIAVSTFIVFLCVFLFCVGFPSDALVFKLYRCFPSLCFRFRASVSSLRGQGSRSFVFFVFFVRGLSRYRDHGVSS